MIERREFESLYTEVECDSVSLRIHSLCSRGEPGKGSPIVLVPGQGASGVTMLPTARLLPRERDVLREMASGKSNAAIADALYLTESSVEKVIHSMFQKLELTWEPSIHKRVKAVILYMAESG